MTESGKNIPKWILGYGCVSLAGGSVPAFFNGLIDGIDHSRIEQPAADSAFDAIVLDLESAWRELEDGLTETTRSRIRNSGRLGVIFASTKGCIDDFIFLADSPLLTTDPLTPILRKFLEVTKLSPAEKTSVSNACVSTLSALQLARIWIQSDRATDVLVIAADRKGPFVSKGFATLNVISPERARPFSAKRSGFFIGSAAAAILVSCEQDSSNLKLSGVVTDSAGSLMTNVKESTASLKRSCVKLGTAPPELIIAHGTATLMNDAIEDAVFDDLSTGPWQHSPPVTSTKWSIGHTLAASGAMDFIAACEILRQQRVFRIANTETQDEMLKSNILTLRSIESLPGTQINRVLVSSLGFGGVHGAMQIEREM